MLNWLEIFFFNDICLSGTNNTLRVDKMKRKREKEKNLLSHTLQHPTEATSTGELLCHTGWKD